MRAINTKPDRTWSFALAALPFFAVLIAYLIGSEMRLAENPNDKLLPSFGTMAESLKHMALTPDPQVRQLPDAERHAVVALRSFCGRWPSRPRSRWCRHS